MIIEVAERLKTTKEYYFSTKLEEVRKLRSQGKDILNIAIGNPDMPPSPQTIEALASSIKDQKLHGYPPYKGIPELRNALQHWMHDTYGVSLDPNKEILPLIGSKEGITHISLAFLNPGDQVLVPELGYPAYRAVTEMVGGNAIPYPMNEGKGYQPDFEELDKMDLSRVKLMWVNYPNMPTGAPPSKMLFQQLVEFAKSNEILICHDNPYSLVLNNEDPISLLSIPGAKEVALELNSFSKSHNMAGWRVGWLSASVEYLEQIVKIKTNIDTGMFMPIQLAAAQALKNEMEWHDLRNEEYRSRRTYAYEVLNQLGCTYSKDQVGMFTWAKIPDYVSSSKALIDKLLYDYNIFIAPGFIFGPKGERFIRISLCVDKSILKEASERLISIDLNNI